MEKNCADFIKNSVNLENTSEAFGLQLFFYFEKVVGILHKIGNNNHILV